MPVCRQGMELSMSRRRTRSGRTVMVILALTLIGSGFGRTERKPAFVDPLLARILRASEKAARDTGRPDAIPVGQKAMFARVAAVSDTSEGLVVGVRLRLDAAARHAIEALGIRTYGRLEGFASAVV